MGEYGFERECRTPYSEVYTIVEDDAEEPIGRLDLHITSAAIHATLCVDESLTQEAIHDLIEAIEEELAGEADLLRELEDVVGVSREEFIIHVHQGRDVGVFSNNEFDGNGGGGGL